MARKEAATTVETRGFSDIIGIVLISLAFLLLLALFSFDRNDVATNRVPANEHVSNWIGPVGAYSANALFFVLGAAGYLVPLVLLGLGLGHLFRFLGYLRRRWPWALALLLATAGGFDLYSVRLDQVLGGALKQSLNTPGAGGLAGYVLNHDIFERYFGSLGATLVFATAYLVSLLALTNIHLGEWLLAVWQRSRTPAVEEPLDEKALEKRARELAKEAKRLQAEVDRSGIPALLPVPEPAEKTGIGQDLRPVPEPTVRDLSVPQSTSGAPPAKKSKAPPEPERLADTLEGEVISAKEIAAATTEDILGKAGETKSPAAGESAQPDAAPPPPPPPRPKPAPRKPKPITVASTPIIGNYQLPAFDLLNYPDPTVKPTESKEDLMANARLMQNTLAQFDIEVALGDITKGPTITRYELHPAPGVRLEKITALGNNLAAALKAENVHILAPVPGKSSVGIEVPNLIKTKVIMRDLLESEEWRNTKARIPLALGKDVYGHPIIADLAEMPHLLIAGSTGSGKSVCINSITASLLFRFSPDQLRFVMIDPKVVELQFYNALPHLVVPVVTDPKKVVLALRWVVNEMEKRYQIFARVGVRNIKSFNERSRTKPAPPAQPELPLMGKKERVEAGSEGFAVELDEEIVVPRDDDIVIPEKLSYIVVIIDELADLMLVAPADVEMAIARITQMARAAGIHCIVATQRPSVDVITGVIKANIPARIAFQVAAKVDSRTILDAMGADKLLGKGDMLYLPPGSSRLIRAQGALITDTEIQGIVDFISKQGKPSYEIEIHQQLSKPAEGLENGSGCDEDENLIQQCIEVIRSEQKASVSLMQRRLRLGYTRAARIMDELENRGIVGPSKGAEPRDILIDLDAAEAESSEPTT
jgi:S-DNA-T family DNA segregation ATPase FtsK/SpoIIIE